MSEDRSAIIHRSYKAFCDDDPDTLLTLYHSDAVWDFSHWEGWPDATAYRGSDIADVLGYCSYSRGAAASIPASASA